jgi:ubiquinone/menaquinone biosynthesis C-methylase UbiE
VHTGVLLETGASVTATDISPGVLELLQRRLAPTADGRLTTRVADMEALPFDAESFDTVVCAGSLSYGDADLVDREILRVLRPGGNFISVDSLSHNPVYRFNRWVNYRRGQRTRSTLLRMPTANRIERLARHFTQHEVRYFGSITWTMPVLMRMLGAEHASRVSDAFDRLIDVKRSAFKYVLAAQGRR